LNIDKTCQHDKIDLLVANHLTDSLNIASRSPESSWNGQRIRPCAQSGQGDLDNANAGIPKSRRSRSWFVGEKCG
jgi:hypothetical protein